MNKLSIHIWFDKQAVEAAEFYEKVFGAKITDKTVIHDTPSGDCDIVNLDIANQHFTFISAGPYFKANPSISFTVSCTSKEQVQQLWDKLSEGGEAMMELGAYPFSPKYGWIADKFGVSWQLSYMDPAPETMTITPSFLFVGDVCGKAEEAINFYTSVFRNSGIDLISRYPAGMEPDKEGTINYAAFHLEGQGFVAMDSAHDHKFQFTEGISIMINCQDQEEIDYYWEKLSAVPESEQCGWLKDKYGVSWQVHPQALSDMLASSDEAGKKRVTEAFLKMKKFDIAALKKAFLG